MIEVILFVIACMLFNWVRGMDTPDWLKKIGFDVNLFKWKFRVYLSTRILSALGMGISYGLYQGSAIGGIIVAVGWFIWAVFPWLPKDEKHPTISGFKYEGNWSAQYYIGGHTKRYQPVGGGVWYIEWPFKAWYSLTALRQLASVPLFVALYMYSIYISLHVIYMWQSLIIILGWGIVYYVVSPNCLKLNNHTTYAELIVGLLWGLALL